MLAVGFAMLLSSWWAAFTLLRRKVCSPLLLRVLSLMTFSGWVAVLAGWYVTEVGRQPWMVYGQLRISELVADHAPGTVLTTLIAYVLLYGFLLVSYIATLRYMATKPARSLMELQQPAITGGEIAHG